MKKKKKKHKEEESRQCSNEPDDETKEAEPPFKKCTMDDAISKKAAGTRAETGSRAQKLRIRTRVVKVGQNYIY